jgi:hypothetical protein
MVYFSFVFVSFVLACTQHESTKMKLQRIKFLINLPILIDVNHLRSSLLSINNHSFTNQQAERNKADLDKAKLMP